LETTDNGIPIELVNDSEHLQAVVERLCTLQEIAIDTEFDSFNKQYGIQLQLLQVFDGTMCFLIDPLEIKNLEALWSVFKDRAICKLVYSGSNDVDILKRHGCSPVNLFDIQVAAELCKWPETSLSKVLQQEFGVTADKSLQSAGWGNRPLSSRQLTYAGNDVIYLPRLKDLLLPEIKKHKLGSNLQEQNLKLEAASSKDYFPKLNGRQRATFSRYSQQKLLDLKILIDEYAQEVNLPPFKIVQDSFLEEILKDMQLFLKEPFPEKKFHYSINKNERFIKGFVEMVQSINGEIEWERKRRY
jgi:ribonuclease D